MARVADRGGATDSSWNAHGLGANPEGGAGAIGIYSRAHRNVEPGRLPTGAVAFPPRRVPGAVLLRRTVHAPPPVAPRGRPGATDVNVCCHTRERNCPSLRACSTYWRHDTPDLFVKQPINRDGSGQLWPTGWIPTIIWVKTGARHDSFRRIASPALQVPPQEPRQYISIDELEGRVSHAVVAAR